MRTPGTDLDLKTLVNADLSSPGSSEKMFSSSQLSYHEMADIPVRETDLLEQLEANMRQLEDLQDRMKFMMREIRYVMKV
jgi:hypothetical protein